MSKVGMAVTYMPTMAEDPHPIGPGKYETAQQAALITAWDEHAETATLAIFAPGVEYFRAKYGVMEGTVPGTFQQPATPEVPPPAPPELEIKPMGAAAAARPNVGKLHNKEKGKVPEQAPHGQGGAGKQ